MNKEMIISSNGHETRVAILEDDQLAELFVEREQNRGVVGNVYKGRVSKVLPGMQSSFVDIGLERDGFLYVSDVIANLDEYDSDDEDQGGNGAKGANGKGANGAEGSTEGSSAPPERRRGRDGRGRDREERDRGPEPKIEELVKEGQDVIVQVAKEPLGTKGARLTCHVTLPGRFLVFMPTVDHIGISRKIDSREERSRLRGIVREFREQHSFSGGVIIRTAASGRSKEDILADLNYFYKIWVDMRQRGEQRRSPVTVYQEPSLVAKLLRDLLTDDYSAIRIDHPVEHQRALEFIGRIMPNLANRVKRYDKDFPIFEEYGVQAELDKALRSKVWLKSGGSIVINQTEALVAIDVNTGRYIGKKTAGRLEDTIVKTNLEAAKEIVRQIRLRDLGGIIVCDFIDMETRSNRDKVLQELRTHLGRDRARTKALAVSELGLVEMTRQRVRPSLWHSMTTDCPTCAGSGRVFTPEVVARRLERALKRAGHEHRERQLTVRLHPEVALYLLEEEPKLLQTLSKLTGLDLELRDDPMMRLDEFRLMSRPAGRDVTELYAVA